MKKLIAVTFFVLSSTFVFSQALGIEEFRFDSDSSNLWLGNAGAYLKMIKQKNSVFEAELNAQTAYLSKQHNYMLFVDMDFQNVRETEVVSKGFAHFRTNLYRKRKIIPEFFVQNQFDAGRGLTERQLIGAGPRFNIKSSDSTNVTLNASLFYEREVWLNDEDSISFDIDNNNPKVSFNVTLRHNLTKSTTFFMTAFYQVKPNDWLSPRITGDTYLSVGITNKVLLRVSYNIQYDSKPIVEIARLNYLLKMGVFYTFNKG